MPATAVAVLLLTGLSGPAPDAERLPPPRQLPLPARPEEK